MNFHTIETIRHSGFTGFLRPPELLHSDFRSVPQLPGVYLVLRDPSSPPKFTPHSRGGHFKGCDPTVPISTLQARWVPGAAVLYIGKASIDLRRRLRSRRPGAPPPFLRLLRLATIVATAIPLVTRVGA